jgi:hypothetical protein
MDYLTIEQAHERDVLRLVLTASVPGPWSEAAKALFRHHKFPTCRFDKGAGRIILNWLSGRVTETPGCIVQ